MKKIVSVLVGVSAFMGISGLALFADTTGAHVEAAVVAQQNSANTTSSKSKVKSALINMTGKYDNVKPGRRYGTTIPQEEKIIAGVSIGSSFDAIMQSLGKPDKIEYGRNKIESVTYGGIYFGVRLGSENMHLVIITNRDAATVRGIAVGDTLEKVYSVYGQSDTVSKKSDSANWFYGKFSPMSDDVSGIRFFHDGNKVTKIVIL